MHCINVHMPLHPLRLAVFHPEVYRESRRSAAFRRAAMARLAETVRNDLARGPVLVAGDWNTPARISSLRPMRRLLDDAFQSGGAGWGNTVTSEFPVSRIDIIYVSDRFDVVHCEAIATDDSDHRMVLAELWLKAPESDQRGE